MFWQIVCVAVALASAFASGSEEMNAEEVCEYLKQHNSLLANMDCTGISEGMLNAMIDYFNSQGMNIIDPNSDSDDPLPSSFSQLRSNVEEIVAAMPPSLSFSPEQIQQILGSSMFAAKSGNSPPKYDREGQAAPYLSQDFLASLFKDD